MDTGTTALVIGGRQTLLSLEQGTVAGVDRRRLAEIDQTLLMHDEGLKDLYQKLIPLLESDPEPQKMRIGFGEADDNEN